mmetsp:Transcript_5360/g.9104  ORF Transcript_5360/g.9104 Transcript_5360/m.9104 type:complete len:148 (+) Transcript_5360:76-519(+)
MKSSMRSLILLICCWAVPGEALLRPRRPFIVGKQAVKPHLVPAKSFDVDAKKCTDGVDRVEADESSYSGTSISGRADVLSVRGGASVVGVVTSPAFWLMSAMVALRVMGDSVPYAKLIEGVLTVVLIGYFFLLLTKWQENVQAGNAD